MTNPLILDLDASDYLGTPGADYWFLVDPCWGATPISAPDTLITGGDPILRRATITLTNGATGDYLESGSLPAGIIASAFDAATGGLTLTGDATRADYQAAIEAIGIAVSPFGATVTRQIVVRVQDAAGNWSNTALSQAEIPNIDLPSPIVDLDADSSTALGADYAGIFQPGQGGVPIADVDPFIKLGTSYCWSLTPAIQEVRVRLENPSDGDALSLDLPNPWHGITASYDSDHLSLTLTGEASTSDYESAIRAVRFDNSEANPNAYISREISIQVTDRWGNVGNVAIARIRFTLPGPVILDGNARNNYLSGDANDDRIAGLGGNDTIRGFVGNDMIIGGSGDDLLVGGGDNDQLLGGSGIDTASFLDDRDGVTADLRLGASTGGDCDDTLDGIENLQGSRFNDHLLGDQANNVLNGNDGNDSLAGGGGRDLLTGGIGNDRLLGGAGIDTASFLEARDGITADLQLGLATGDDNNDTLVGIENFIGSRFDDRLLGDQADNLLRGKGGNDRLVGRSGDDRLLAGGGDDTVEGGDDADLLSGGAGNDILTGGTGADTFRFDIQPHPSNKDSITDFTPTDDIIQLDSTVFTGITTQGRLRLDAFGDWGAADASNRVLYDRATGTLVYDPDGSGPEMATIFAMVQPGLAITHLNFVVT